MVKRGGYVALTAITYSRCCLIRPRFAGTIAAHQRVACWTDMCTQGHIPAADRFLNPARTEVKGIFVTHALPTDNGKQHAPSASQLRQGVCTAMVQCTSFPPNHILI